MVRTQTPGNSYRTLRVDKCLLGLFFYEQQYRIIIEILPHLVAWFLDMRTVSRFEANLMQILHCALGRAPLSQTLPLIVRSVDRPPCLGRDCVELIQQALANGIVSMLAANGGWQQERFLRGTADERAISAGRLWQRTKPAQLGLEFSVNSVDFLMWLTATSPTKARWKPHKLVELTTGDRFLVYLAYRMLRNTEAGSVWCKQPLVHTNGLCTLMFADDFVDYKVVPEPDFSPWLTPAGIGILESAQDELADRWVEMERVKAQVITPARMRIFGQIQETVVKGYLDAIDNANRRDLSRFLLMVADRVLKDSPSMHHWTGGLKVDGLRIADRISTYESAFSLLRQLERLSQWEESSRNVGYFDENYAASQLWKADWERFHAGDRCEAASQIIRQAEPMGSGSAEQSH